MGHDAFTAPAGGWPVLDALVADVVAVRAEVAALQAREARLLSEAVELVASRLAEGGAATRRSSDLPLREVSAELGAAMRVSDRTVQGRMGDAATLCSRFPATMRAWEAGRIDGGHVSVILDAGTVIVDDGLRVRFEESVLDAAATESPTRLRSIARAIAAHLDPDAATVRRSRALADRQVRVFDLGDGLGRVQLDTDLVLARAVEDRLTCMARELRAQNLDDAAESVTSQSDAAATVDGVVRVVTRTDPSRESSGLVSSHDGRTLDQLRADIAADLLLAGGPAAHGEGDALAAVTGHVQVTVPVLTLAGLGGEPALLAGDGPIDPETARALAARAPGWDRVMTHPSTGAVLAVDRYRPSSDLSRFLRARDERCRFPGCRRPPVRCDIDHTVDAAQGGGTSHCNLAHLCRRHHTLKHETAWTVRQLGGGVLEWTSPTGRRYLDRPPSTVRFVPTDWADLARARLAPASAQAPPDGDDPPPF